MPDWGACGALRKGPPKPPPRGPSLKPPSREPPLKPPPRGASLKPPPRESPLKPPPLVVLLVAEPVGVLPVWVLPVVSLLKPPSQVPLLLCAVCPGDALLPKPPPRGPPLKPPSRDVPLGHPPKIPPLRDISLAAPAPPKPLRWDVFRVPLDRKSVV